MDVALWLRIFGRLDADDLVRASAVCREWRDVCDDDFLWTELTRRDAPATLVARDEMGEDSRRAYFCNEAWRCGAFIRRPDPVLSAPCVAMAFHESSANLVSVTADGVLSTTPLDADDGAPSSPPDPPLGDARSSPTAPIHRRRVPGFLPSRRRGRLRRRPRTIRIIRIPPTSASRLVARYDGRVTALACLARRDADDQAILAMSTRKTIGAAPGFGGAGNKGMLRCCASTSSTTATTRGRRRRRTTRGRHAREERDAATAATASPFAARCAAAALRMARDERRGDDPRRRAPTPPPDLSSPGTRGAPSSPTTRARDIPARCERSWASARAPCTG